MIKFRIMIAELLHDLQGFLSRKGMFFSVLNFINWLKFKIAPYDGTWSYAIGLNRKEDDEHCEGGI